MHLASGMGMRSTGGNISIVASDGVKKGGNIGIVTAHSTSTTSSGQIHLGTGDNDIGTSGGINVHIGYSMSGSAGTMHLSSGNVLRDGRGGDMVIQAGSGSRSPTSHGGNMLLETHCK